MMIVFFWNYLNHHQVCVADELHKLLGNDFCFVATLPRNENELKGDMDYSSRPYCILAAESEDAHVKAMEYAMTADVCVFGACSQEYAIHRAIHNPKGFSFEAGERWLKRGWMNILSPVLRTWWLNYQKYYRKANFYKLCSSAFAAGDEDLLGCYNGRHFKWGYFIDTPSDNLYKPHVIRRIRIMWCARFISWKHPELAIECAKRLKEENYEFQLDMYGDGPLRAKCEELVKKVGLCNEVVLGGNIPNNNLIQAMRESDIFLFTSDRQEGWGVVANEAMAAGCCLVAGDKIGSAPYLIRNGVNGYMFRDKDADSLYRIVKQLMDNPNERIQLVKQAQEDMVTLWSPHCAAKNFLQLVDDIIHERKTSIKEGPCSKA